MDLGRTHTWRRLRAAAVAAAAALALGATACGGSDDEGDAPESGGATSQAQTEVQGGGGQAAGRDGKQSEGPALTGNVEEAKRGVESVDQVYEDFGAAVEAGISKADVPARQTLDEAGGNKSLTGVCDLMSKEAKQQTIVYAKRSAGLADVKWTCEKATGLLLRRAGQTGGLKRTLRAKVVGVNVEGDRATASIRFGGKGPISSIPLVKEDGKWKLAASPSGGDGK